jgi:hypothetical protein
MAYNLTENDLFERLIRSKDPDCGIGIEKWTVLAAYFDNSRTGNTFVLTNVPTVEDLDEMALRLYFDAWERSLTLLSDFAEVFAIGDAEPDDQNTYKAEWGEYVAHAQSEMGAICATIQQSAELRLKAIVCGTSPFLLLLNSAVSFKANQQHDLDFSELRTLDAVDLPNAVHTLTQFNLPDSYIEQYGNMRRLRNQVTHLGSHRGDLTPRRLIEILSQQYVSLWPGGRWLYRRVRFDGNSARNFFHDQRYSSVESNVMAELPYTIKLLGNSEFKKAFGIAKGKLKGFCPFCMDSRATKWDADGHATVYQTGSNTATCAMCERDLTLQITDEDCDRCGSKTYIEGDNSCSSLCLFCGHG